MDPETTFCLQNVQRVLSSSHGFAGESTKTVLAGDGGAVPSQSETSLDSRVARWAFSHGQAGSPSEFAARLHGPQVGSELLHIFRETPEFGRSLATRIEPFLDEKVSGTLRLLGGGGEAIIFGDHERQLAVKLLAPPGKARFGWVLEQDTARRWVIRGGGLAEALLRFAWFETLFESGLDLDQIGTAADFLVLRQPFIEGCHPDEPSLARWMTDRGWSRWSPPTDLDMIAHLTWRRDEWIATDVRPENALIAEADGGIRAIDFIMGRA